MRGCLSIVFTILGVFLCALSGSPTRIAEITGNPILTGAGPYLTAGAFAVAGLLFVAGGRHRRRREEERRHQEQLIALQQASRAPVAPSQARMFRRAKQLYQAGEKGKALGILETLAAEGYDPARQALARLNKK